MRIWNRWLLVTAAIVMGGAAMAQVDGRVTATLNGLTLTFDRATGSLLLMDYPGPGKMLDAPPSDGGLVDLAYPIPKFEPLRLATRFSSGAKVTVEPGRVTVVVDKLGASRGFALDGNVATKVVFTEDPDGRSIVLTCEVANHSPVPVRQVMFPDFHGLLPTAGADQTILKTCGFGRAPFQELRATEDRLSTQFCMDDAGLWSEFAAGGMFHPMWLRWLDLGGLNGGFSVFPRRWGWDPQVPVRVHHSPTEDKLRLLWMHNVEVKPGEKWSSGEFVLTPHRQGWAKGIEVYRTWARAHIRRAYPVPKHIREALGFRSMWMCQGWQDDPKDAAWRFADLPAVADEAREHGLTEMVLWGWCPGFELPLPGPYPHVGSWEEMTKAVAECRKRGVNVAPFISVLQADRFTAPKYGLQVAATGGWTQHTETIPGFQPPYSGLLACAQVDTANPVWQREALESCMKLADLGMPSISWDQFWNTQATPNIPTIVEKVRAAAKKRDPESTFSGEELWNMELDCSYLDYTWNWGGYRDCQAFNNVFPAPRINCCVSDSPWTAKRAFMDNLFLCVFPRRADAVNGSDRIAQHPDLSAALKQCAGLRHEFLRYFTEGTLIGNCILTVPTQGATVSSYVLPDRVLLLAFNEGADGPLELHVDPAPWLSSTSGRYTVTTFSGEGKAGASRDIAAGSTKLTTPTVKHHDLVIYEMRPAL